MSRLPSSPEVVAPRDQPAAVRPSSMPWAASSTPKLVVKTPLDGPSTGSAGCAGSASDGSGKLDGTRSQILPHATVTTVAASAALGAGVTAASAAQGAGVTAASAALGAGVTAASVWAGVDADGPWLEVAGAVAGLAAPVQAASRPVAAKRATRARTSVGRERRRVCIGTILVRRSRPGPEDVRAPRQWDHQRDPNGDRPDPSTGRWDVLVGYGAVPAAAARSAGRAPKTNATASRTSASEGRTVRVPWASACIVPVDVRAGSFVAVVVHSCSR